MFLTSAVCFAQGSVSNAVGTNYSQSNVLAPEMLATVVDYQALGVPIPGLSHVLIRPAGAAQAIPATVISGRAFLVPAGIPVGTAELVWQIGSAPYKSIDVKVASQNFELSPTIASVGLSTPAKPGQTLALTGSGLGYGAQVTATLGGLPATILYAGRGSPAGMDLIQLQIPAGVADSCYSPLILNVGTAVLRSAIPVTADGSPCHHPMNLSLNDLKNLDNGGTLSVVEVDLMSGLNAALASAAHREESAYAYVYLDNASGVARYFSPGPGATSGCTAPAPVSFTLSAVFGIPEPVPSPPGTPPQSITLSAGTTRLTAQASGVYYGFTLPPALDGPLSSPPAPVFAPGKWTLSAPDLPFAFPFNLPAPVQLAANAPLSLARTQDQTIAWNGSAYDPGAIAHVNLSTSTQYVTCSAPAQSGSLTIPASYLAPFAAKTLGTLRISITPGPATVPGAVFQTPGAASQAFVVVYSTSDARPVDFQ
jgi:hypothetical protein